MTSVIARLSGMGGSLLLVLIAPLQVSAQPAPDAAPLTFEVASIKVDPPGVGGVRGGCRGIDSVYSAKQQEPAPPLGRCVITGARLSHLIGIAFGVSMQNLNTGPDWIQRGDLRFDVQAKAENPAKTTQKQLLTMLQNMLVERFQLKFHYVKTETAGFALTVAKNGLKLQKSTGDDESLSFVGPKGEAQLKPAQGRPTSMTARKYTIPMLVNLLSAFGSSGPGVDKTELTGDYDFTLSWDDEAGPSLVTALRQQLGLQMKPEKVPVSTFVVDSAEKPTAN